MTSTPNIFQTIVIGGGPAGMTALLYLLRAKINVCCIVSRMGGQIADTSSVDNYPGFHNISGQDLVDKIENQLKHYNPNIIFGHVKQITKTGDIFSVELNNKKIYHTKTIIICSGSTNKLLNIKYEDKLYGNGIYTCANCDSLLSQNKNVLIVGGGNKGVEDALLLTKYAKHITLIHKHGYLKAEKILIEKLNLQTNINYIFNDTIKSFIIKEENGKIFLKGVTLHSKRIVECDMIFLAIGSTPNYHIIQNLALTDERGYIKIDNNFMTSCKGMFAAGEIADSKYRQMITSCGFGCACALEVINFLNYN